MMQRDRVGLAVTPSRRTDPAAVAGAARDAGAARRLGLGRRGDNPYFGMLGLADAIVVTQDSVSMISEAVGDRRAGADRAAARPLPPPGAVP